MTKEEILEMAKNETTTQKMDEREKKDFDRSFYWAFIGIAIASVILCGVKLYREESVDDIIFMLFTGAFSASTYRAAKWKKLSYVLLAGLNLVCAVLYGYSYIFGK
ncbi:MAG: hypothetical protein IKS13_04620 [Ruminococcus sp.]|nr:hypothetical protein [Ruminococcus sp.]